MVRAIPLAEINTPWPSQPIVWRAHDDVERTENLRTDISEGRDFVVREVLVNHPRHRMVHSPYLSTLSKRRTKSALRMADREFKAFTDAGFVCPPTEWHVFADREDRVRTLARVAVIEGTCLFVAKYYSQMDEAEQAVRNDFEDQYKKYLLSPAGGKYYLDDTHSTRQFMEGQLRNQALSAILTPDVSTCLADIEPSSWCKRP